jgi:N-methylhydantoinase B
MRGMPFYDSVELDELHCPLIVHARRLRRDSEGAGMFRGAPGAEIEYGPVDCAVEVGFAWDGVVNPAQGFRAGGPGALAAAYRRRSSGERESLPGSSHLLVAEGESLVSLIAGGGGYRSPLDRAPEHVAHDVAAGWISLERARNVYGVEVTPEGVVDREMTERLRHRLAAA